MGLGVAAAERLQPPQQIEGAGEIVDQHALGGLDLEPRRRKSGLQQDLVDGPFEVAGLKLDRRQVDRPAMAAARTPPRGTPRAKPIRRSQ